MATGLARPNRDQLGKLVRLRKAQLFRFKDDGIIPNHPRWPLIIYRSAVRREDAFDPAAVFEDLFESNGWGDSWRDGIYAMFTITRASMKCWELPVVKARCNLVG
jgi:uncharacterized protein YjlB